MPLIVETIITTMNAAGELHAAPLGLIRDGEHWIIGPFKPSRTLENVRATPFFTASHTDDVRVFAGAVTGRKGWPLVPAMKIKGGRLKDCIAHWELQIERVIEDEVRPRFVAAIVHHETHAPWGGFNRAQAAVLELAVLTTRLHLLPPEKIETELEYLEIAVFKTAGPREVEAWGWLMEKIDTWRAGKLST
jgi:hypothetical protein